MKTTMTTSNKTIRFTLTPADSEAVAVLMSSMKMQSAHDVLRHLLRAAADEERKDQRRYGSRGPSAGRQSKQLRDDAITSMKTMDDITLTKHLIEIEYSKPWHEPADEPGIEFREIIWTDPVTLMRHFVQERWSVEEKKRVGSRLVFTFDELIKDLIKEKKI